jgi:hypothetical protein
MASQTDYRFGPWYDLYTGWPGILSMRAESAITKGQLLQLDTSTYARGVKPYDGNAATTTPIIGIALEAAGTAGDDVTVVGLGPVMLVPCGAAGATAGQWATPSGVSGEEGQILSKAFADGSTVRAYLGLCLTTGDAQGELIAVMYGLCLAAQDA